MALFTTYGVIGSPVRHSLSPACFNTFIQHYGLNAAFITIDVKKGEIHKFFDETIPQLGIGGFTVTMPLKEDIIPFCTELSDAARECHSVNGVHISDDGSLHGHTTDGLGCLRSIQANGVDVSGKKTIIYGAGGAALSIAQAYRTAGANVVLLSRDPAKSKAIADRLSIDSGDSNKVKEYLSDCRIYINASPVGMKGSPDYEDTSFIDCMPNDCVVYEAIYNPAVTTLVKIARERGLLACEGLDMFLMQMGELFEVLTGIFPDKEILAAARGKVEKMLAMPLSIRVQ